MPIDAAVEMPIEHLPTAMPVSIGPVIVEDTTKVFRLPDVVLFYLDSMDLDFSRAIFNIKNPSPLANDEGRVIGAANIYIKNNCVMADLVFDYATPERLDIQSGVVSLYAQANGTIALKHTIIDLSHYNSRAKQEVNIVTVNSVTLTPTSPSDARLQTLRTI